jgi:hypothetical protein
MEAATGFEPVNNGFADRRLTTWLCRPLERETGFEPCKLIYQMLAVQIRPWAVNYPERLLKKVFNLIISSGETSIKFTPHR